MNENQLLLLWGKTCRDANDPNANSKYHPLFFHLLDVAHCALALWDTVLDDNLKSRVAAALECDVEAARLVFACLAGAHDVGKANPFFQFQATPLDWLRAQIENCGWNQPPDPRNQPHNFVSTKDLIPRFGGGFWRADAQGAVVLAHITGAHHGTFPRAENYAPWAQNVMGDAQWSRARGELLELLRQTLCGKGFESPFTHWPQRELGAIPLLAGLISVADWLGSSLHFEVAARRDQEISIEDYLPKSRANAQRALDEFGFRATPEPKKRVDFEEFWQFAPNALQRAVIKVTRDLDAPFLLLVEAPMGIGKTEGALWASDAAQLNRINRGFYVALPTQATSNAMHERVKDFLDRRLPDQSAIHLQLVHGNAPLSDSAPVVFKGLHPMWGEENADGQRELERVVAASWFCGAKRPLLAPFGVGTIDQALMGALQTRHWFVRLFGLAGKVVIFDEVHAYDAYMSGILTTLLGWLKELNCSVILLSATLPHNKRHELLAAWSDQQLADEAPYPRLTMCRANALESIEVSREDVPQKAVAVGFVAPAMLAAKLRQQLQDGGCAAIICNTVGEAQSLFTALKDELGDFCDDWTLFHARMPFAWRQKREAAILGKFGKKKIHRPHRAIVVATQVIEQSLDLDFDLMFSQMAPSDLLLQRLGRLHRHQHDEHQVEIARPQGLRTPQFFVLCEPGDGEVPSFGHSEYVYQREILLRSYLLWRARTSLKIPDDIELLVEQTYAPALPDAPDEKWRVALEESARKAQQARHKAAETAGRVVIATCSANGKLRKAKDVVNAPDLDLRDPDDPNVHIQMRAATRDGDPSVRAICLCQIGEKIYLPDENGAADLICEIDFSQEVNAQTARDLIHFSVPISQKSIYPALIGESVPDSWKKSPFLRHARPLIFYDGARAIGGYNVTLHGELGLVWEKIIP